MSVLYFIFVQLILLVPGWALVRATKWLKDKPALELCAAYLTSIFILAAFAVGGYVFDISRYWLHTLPWVLIAFGFYFFWKQRLYRSLAEHRFPLLALIAMSLFSCAFINLTLAGSRPFYPDPQRMPQNNYSVFSVKVLNVAQTPANDNYVPYRQAQFMVNRSDPAKDSFIEEWGVGFFQRTPLMGAVTAQFFNLLGDTPPINYTWAAGSVDPAHTYIKFQIIAQIMNSLFVIPGFFLLARLFNRRTAQIATLFIVPNAYFLYDSFFSWPKSLVAFFILFSWLLLFEKRLRYVLLAGAASGMAYLTHDLAVMYIGSSVLLLLYWRRFRDILAVGGLYVVFAFPWLFASDVVYKQSSTFIYYPISLHDIPQVSQKHQIIHEFLHTSPLRILAIKVQSLFYLLSPYQLLFSEGGQELGRRLWAATLFNMPGAVGFGLMLPMYAGVLKKLRDIPFWIMFVVPVVLSTIVIGWPKGLGALHFAEASVALGIGLAVWVLLKLRSKLWLWLAFVINCAQMIFFGLFSYNFHVRAWLDPRDLVLLAGMTFIILGCTGGIYAVYSQKKGAWRLATSKLRLS